MPCHWEVQKVLDHLAAHVRTPTRQLCSPSVLICSWCGCGGCSTQRELEGSASLRRRGKKASPTRATKREKPRQLKRPPPRMPGGILALQALSEPRKCGALLEVIDATPPLWVLFLSRLPLLLVVMLAHPSFRWRRTVITRMTSVLTISEEADRGLGICEHQDSLLTLEKVKYPMLNK